MQSQKAPHQSIRLFENDLLERLSHVHPITPLLVWSPVAAWLFWRAFAVDGLGVPGVVAVAFAGVFVWTLVEYIFHRFLFHYPAKSKAGKWLVFLFHGNHHDDPMDKTRLVFPPAGAIPIMALLYLLFSLVIPAHLIAAFMAGFIVGYLMYDYIHYATHHFHMRNRLAKFLKHYHLRHHFSRQVGRYGVSSPLWDAVFGTWPRR
ncbi:sterol desaturase family protein [Haliea sp. E17]|uniref:sterol desaturase family protein n=1 Tax=Haliea sp. E17 TaxID=3401576 RepID=UPI003AAD898F